MAITKNLVNIGDANISNTLTAEALKKRNGTNKQILLADGTTKDMGTGTTTFLRNDGTWATPSTGTDEKQKVTAITSGTFYLSGVGTTSTTPTVGVADATIKVVNRVLTVTSASLTNATISTANITTINGVTVGNSPKFTDTNTTYSVTTSGSGNALTTIGLSGTTITATLGSFATSGHNHNSVYSSINHTHGNITKDGKITTSNSIANGDAIVISRTTSGTISKSTITFDGTTSNSFLSKKGTWVEPADEKVKVSTSTTNAKYPLMAVNSTSPTTGATYQAICDTGITMNPNKHLLSVSGEVNAANGFFQTSDINKKNIIGELDLDKAYDLIDKCQTILYTLKDDDSDKEQIGLIAQEVKEFFPELITEDNDGSLALDYSRLSVVILKVLKDIINRIKILESKYIETYY